MSEKLRNLERASPGVAIVEDILFRQNLRLSAFVLYQSLSKFFQLLRDQRQLSYSESDVLQILHGLE
jgi:hypothetical protein